MNPPTTEPASTSKTPATKQPVERMALRLDEIASSVGVSRRAIERERSAGRFPAPDAKVGKMPLWKTSTIEAWLDGRAR